MYRTKKKNTAIFKTMLENITGRMIKIIEVITFVEVEIIITIIKDIHRRRDTE